MISPLNLFKKINSALDSFLSKHINKEQKSTQKTFYPIDTNTSVINGKYYYNNKRVYPGDPDYNKVKEAIKHLDKEMKNLDREMKEMSEELKNMFK